MRKWIAVALVLLAVVASTIIFRPDRALRVATGYVAHNVCSKIFVSGLDPQAAFSETIARDSLRRLRPLLRYHLDRAAKTVDVSVAGLFGSRAASQEDFGCVMLFGSEQPYLLRSDVEALKSPKRRRFAGPKRSSWCATDA